MYLIVTVCLNRFDFVITIIFKRKGTKINPNSCEQFCLIFFYKVFKIPLSLVSVLWKKVFACDRITNRRRHIGRKFFWQTILLKSDTRPCCRSGSLNIAPDPAHQHSRDPDPAVYYGWESDLTLD